MFRANEGALGDYQSNQDSVGFWNLVDLVFPRRVTVKLTPQELRRQSMSPGGDPSWLGRLFIAIYEAHRQEVVCRLSEEAAKA